MTRSAIWRRAAGSPPVRTPSARRTGAERCWPSLMELMDRVFTRLWGEPTALLSALDGLVAAGRGTSEGLWGAAFDPLADAGHPR
jgi:hypothetical protein